MYVCERERERNIGKDGGESERPEVTFNENGPQISKVVDQLDSNSFRESAVNNVCRKTDV